MILWPFFRKTVFLNILLKALLGPFLNDQFNKYNKTSRQTNVKQPFFLYLPYFYPNVKLEFAFRSPRHLSTLCIGKERFPVLLCSNVIYKFTCNGCSATYYGKTSRNLLIRCREHLGINKLGQEVKSYSPSSIKEHNCKSGPYSDFLSLFFAFL